MIILKGLNHVFNLKNMRSHITVFKDHAIVNGVLCYLFRV